MPHVEFASLPDDARLWVFAIDPQPDGPAGKQVLSAADAFLAQWRAHGEPLTCGRDWRDDRFLAIAVDQSSAGASGCSIDGLFRALRELESGLGISILAGGRVFYRDENGAVQCVTRKEFKTLAESGAVTDATRVFDTSITSAGEWRTGFERSVAESWHAGLVNYKTA